MLKFKILNLANSVYLLKKVAEAGILVFVVI